LTFLGQVLPAGTVNNVPSGYSVRSSVAPIPGQLDTTLGLPVSVGDIVYRYDTKKGYLSSVYGTKGWDTKPVLRVGEAFFILKTTPPVSWTSSVPNF
ncbi:MAG TPA: hypothetical protein VH255_05210, partial [Verrucomicrobiae bacterium]|nr:hypothetical protein [Verrucomicrobiae bacterium]